MQTTMDRAIDRASDRSKEIHSVIIGKDSKWYNTWDDWFLIPSSRPLVNPPAPKTKFVDVPGRDGVLDLSELINPYTVYGNRTGNFEFIVDNDHWAWHTAYSTIMSLLQGKSGLDLILLDDRNFYYEGRCSVNGWKSDQSWSIISFDYNVGPYKKRMNTSLEPWKWDPFNFETGVIRFYNQTTISGSKSVTLVGDAIRETPWFTATAQMTVRFKNRNYTLTANRRMQVPDIVIQEGNNILEFTGNGKVSIEYRGGSL